MININRFFFGISNQLRKFYLNSNIYDKKISQINNTDLIYKPSPHLLSSLIKYQKKKFRIEDFIMDNVWDNKNTKDREYKTLNSFYWCFSLDLKSSKQTTQNIITKWIIKNFKYNYKSWNFDLTAKRIIAWLSCHNLTYEDSDQNYKDKFSKIIQKQANHLMNEINKSVQIDDKLIGCSAIILVGLCYQNKKKNYLSNGVLLLKRISKIALDNYSVPKSRNVRQLILYLKYFILIREWFKESLEAIPEFIDETIYYLGLGYAFFCENLETGFLFNGNNLSNNNEFDNYLRRLGYKFKNEYQELGGYIILKNKKVSITMDTGPTPSFDYTKDYQSGALSFEIISNGKKLISNCGYYKKKNKLNYLSKSSAAQSTLVIDDNSSCKFINFDKSWLVKRGLKIIKKNSFFEKNYWKINASHDGYLKKYNSIHEREIEFYPDQMTFIGNDKIIKKRINNNYKFDIRFHVEPNVKLMKTQDNKSILIQLKDEGWKFTCDNYDINIDNGLYFGNKNLYIENQNIFISGVANKLTENIKWEIRKI